MNGKKQLFPLIIGLLMMSIIIPAGIALGDGLSFTESGQFPGGATYVMAMEGDTLYTATGPVVEIWKVSPDGVMPVNYMAWAGTGEMKPQKLGEIRFGNNAVSGLTVDGNRLYVGTGNGLEIYDVTTPSNPQRIGTYYKELIGTMKIKDGLLYASTDFKEISATETHKFVILDVSNPENIVERGNFPIPLSKGHLERFTISGNYAYLAIGYDINPGYVFIVDISNPALPTEVSRIAGNSYAGFTAVEVDETAHILYAFEYRAKLHTYDISNPAAPVELGTIGTDKGLGVLGPGSDMKIRGKYAYFSAFYEGVRVIDISNPRNMTLAAKGLSSDRFGYVHDIILSGDYAYVANMGGGFSIFSIAAPPKPKYVMQLDTHGIFYDVQTSGNYAYVSADYELMVFDITNTNNPVHVGSVEWARAGIGAVKGNYVFLDGGWRPMAVVDVSVPSSPKIVNSYSDHIKIAGIVNDTMFVGHHGEIHALDISHLPDVTLISKVVIPTTNPYPPSMLLNGNYLYADIGDDVGLKIYDVSDPANIKEVSTISSWQGGTMMIKGNYMYAITGYYLYTYDITNPANPVKVNSLKHSSAWHISGAYGFGGTAFYNDYLVRNEDSGLLVWNISNPATPSKGTVIPFPAGMAGFQFADSKFYGAVAYKGVYIYDVNAPPSLNKPPVLGLIGNQTVNTETLLEFAVNATDPDGDALTFSAMDLPAGAAFDAVKHQFSWTPTVDQTGTAMVKFMVSDGKLMDSETVAITVTKANEPPVLGLIGNQTVNAGTLLEFAVNATDPEEDLLAYEVSGLPLGAVFDAEQHRFSWTPTLDQLGATAVNFTVSDGKLMDSEMVVITVTKANEPPVLGLIGNQTVNSGILLEFAVNATDPEEDLLAYEVSDLPLGAVFDAEQHRFSWTPGYDQGGVYEVNFTVSDGKFMDTETVAISVNNVNRPPVLAAIKNKTVNEGTLLRFIVSATDPDGDAKTYRAANLPPGAKFITSGHYFTWTPAQGQAGTYYVNFTVSDGQLEDTATVMITVRNVNNAPALDVIGNKTINEGEPLQFIVNARDSDGDTLLYNVTPLPGGAQFNMDTHQFDWTPGYDQAGLYTMNVTVSDGKLTAMETVTITVNNVNQRPVLTAIKDKTVNEGTLLRFIISATDPDGDAKTYRAANLPPGAKFITSGHYFTWTPLTGQAGTYYVDFTVSDGQLEDTARVMITVKSVNQPPTLEVIDNKTINEGELLKFTISAKDTEGDILTFGATSLPEGSQYDAAAREFSWTPDYDQAGEYNVVFTVSDGLHTVSQIVTIIVNDKTASIPVPTPTPVESQVTVVPTPDGITFTSPAEYSVKEGESLQFTVSAYAPAGSPLTYRANGLILGAQFTPDNQVFSWTPQIPGNYVMTFIATDGTQQAFQDVTITVSPKAYIMLS